MKKYSEIPSPFPLSPVASDSVSIAVDISLSASLSPIAHPAALPKPLLALATITKEERHCARECLGESQPMGAPVAKGRRRSANGGATLTAGLRVEVCLGRIEIDRSARLFF